MTTSLFDTISGDDVDVGVDGMVQHTVGTVSDISDRSAETVMLFEAVDQWLRVESLSSLVSQADMMNIILEFRQSELRYERIHPDFSRRFDGIISRVKIEKRSLRQILDSPKDEIKLLDFVETIDIGDPMIVKLLLQDQMPLFENMLGWNHLLSSHLITPILFIIT